MKKTLLLFTLAFAGVSALAWDPTGHMQVADLAWSGLEPKVKVEIAKLLLEGDPGFRPALPSGEITEAYLEAEVRPMFRKAATWCDVIKGEKSEQYEDKINSLNAASPGVRPPSDVFQKGTEEVRCKTWHYYNHPLFAPQGRSTPGRESNALYAMGKTVSQLQAAVKTPNRKEGAFWLYWLEHLVGDLHMPLHCCQSFTAPNERYGDAGGNLTSFLDPHRENRSTRLHAYMDGAITGALRADGFRDEDLESVTASWTKRSYLKPSSNAVFDLDWQHWTLEGAQLAELEIYSVVRNGKEVPNEFETNMDNLARRQAVLAGARLAALLNARLAPK